MALPKIDLPTIQINIPSLKKDVVFRTFTVREEKILLIAHQTKDIRQISLAVKQIITNCCTDEQIDIEKLALVDIEFIFLRLRAFSVNNISTLTLIDEDDDKEYILKINLNDIGVKFSEEEISNKVHIGESIVLTLQYPCANILNKSSNYGTAEQALDFLVKESIVDVLDGDSLTIMEEESEVSKIEFVNSIPSKPYEEIKAFINTMPSIYYKVEYTNSKGKKKEIVFDSLSDFFTYA